MSLSLLAEVTLCQLLSWAQKRSSRQVPGFQEVAWGSAVQPASDLTPPQAPEHTRHCRKCSSQLGSWTLKRLLQTLPASALLAVTPGTEGSVCGLWGNLKMVPK